MGDLFPAFQGDRGGSVFSCIGYLSFGSGGAPKSAILKEYKDAFDEELTKGEVQKKNID